MLIACIFIAAVEWICWLNGQRKKAPTSEVTQYFFHYQLNLFPSPLIGHKIGNRCATYGLIFRLFFFHCIQEMMELEARRERVRKNVACNVTLQ